MSWIFFILFIVVALLITKKGLLYRGIFCADRTLKDNDLAFILLRHKG